MKSQRIRWLAHHLPGPARTQLRLVRDRVLLRRAPQIACDPARLVPAPVIDFNAIWEDEIAQAAAKTAAEALDASGVSRYPEATNLGDCRALAALVARVRPAAILEVGTHIGASTIAMAVALRNLGIDGKITTVDVLDVNGPDGPWRVADLAGPPHALLRRLDCAELVSFRTARSLEHLLTDEAKYNLIFLDGSHVADTVYTEIGLAFGRLCRNGWIVLHDFYPVREPARSTGEWVPGPALAVARLSREGVPLVALPFGELPWLTKGGARWTSLAALGRTA